MTATASFLLRLSSVAASLKDKTCAFEVRLTGRGTGSTDKLLETVAGGAQELTTMSVESGSEDRACSWIEWRRPSLGSVLQGKQSSTTRVGEHSDTPSPKGTDQMRPGLPPAGIGLGKRGKYPPKKQRKCIKMC